MKKSDLRKLYLEKRASLSALEVASLSRQIAERFFENIDLTGISTVHTFIRIRKFNEIDTSMIYYRLWRDCPRIATAAPRTDLVTGSIESIAFDEGSEWYENSWGIREPVSGEMVEPSGIDLVIVPLLCYEKGGHRVGYGKGMYDSFLARCRPDCLKVGVSFFPPVEVIDDINASDIALDLCVTPSAVFRTNIEVRGTLSSAL